MSANTTLYQLDTLLPSLAHFSQVQYVRIHTECIEEKVLVVGTTSDYVDLLKQSNSGRVLFLTDQSERNKAYEPRPLRREEIVCNLQEDVSLILLKIKDHLRAWNSSLAGVVCFDCESMELAATLAGEFKLPYPPLESIRLCRDKFVTKTIWQQKGVPCPRHRLVRSAKEVIDFWQEISGPIVIKPLSGSGSELVFSCMNRKDCEQATKIMLEGLAERKEMRLYSKATAKFVAEEFIAGNEFSCDFTIKGQKIEILRLTSKLKYTEEPFGTINGYMIHDWQRTGINLEHLSKILQLGAKALGLAHSVCMVDFIVDGDTILLLEMTPRPGGDCIPFLIKRATGFDILSYFIDFARDHTTALPVIRIPGEGLVALRLHAQSSGKITEINSNNLSQDSRIQEVSLIRQAGHQITMPPDDYDSWYLGYAIFQPVSGISVEYQCRELRNLLELEIHYDHI